ncbi:MAG: hypothetical protein ACOYL6_16770 [Bacteriovoracaceae bacterium]
MRYLIILIFFFTTLNCSLKTSPPKVNDIFDDIFSYRGKSKTEIISILGEASKIQKNNNGEEILTFKKNTDTMDIFFDSQSKTEGVVLWYWKKEFDNYNFLKKRFQGYQWEDKELPPVQSDSVNEPHEVKIQELGIEFEYDNQDPQRRPMTIYFNFK